MRSAGEDEELRKRRELRMSSRAHRSSARLDAPLYKRWGGFLEAAESDGGAKGMDFEID